MTECIYKKKKKNTTQSQLAAVHLRLINFDLVERRK